MIKSNITGQQVGANRQFDLAGLKWIGDHGSYYKNTIPNTDNYTFNENTRMLSVNNLSGAGGYAQITTVSGSYGTYKLQLPKVYKVHYNLNGGSGAMSDSECESMDGGCSVTLSSTTPTRTGYRFLGWADSSTATEAQYQPGSQITLSGEDTLKTIYAVWEADTPGPTPPGPTPPDPANPDNPANGGTIGAPNTGAEKQASSDNLSTIAMFALPSLITAVILGILIRNRKRIRW